ncbi:MAG: NAD-dependent epimerase/dehydratase family protein [Solirubrobacterales bacterium]
MSELLHLPAVELWRKSLRADDKVLVLGATGWFGRTATAMLQFAPQPRMLIATSSREYMVGEISARSEEWEWDRVRSFAPTVVLDFAFLTRDLVEAMPLDEYVSRNEELTRRMLAATALPSVKRVLTISSGAAVFPHDALDDPLESNPYGWLKRRAENALADLAAERSIPAIIARAWSVSGAFVQKPASYALSDMILQAATGSIHISATRKVYRRYVAVEDLLAVSLANATEPGTMVIDSGGELVEMGELASLITEMVNPHSTITRPTLGDSAPNDYFADPAGWDAACSRATFAPADLRQQIGSAARGLLPATR